MRLCIFGDARAIHLRRAAAAFARRGATVHIVTGKPMEVPGATVEPFRIPPAGWRNPRRWMSRRRHYLLRHVTDFDVVAIYFLHDWGFTADVLEHGCVVVAPWGSDITPPPGEEPAGTELIRNRKDLIRHAALVHAWGPWFSRRVAEFAGVAGNQVKVLFPGVDLRLFNPDGPGTTDRVRQQPAVGFFKGFRAVYGPRTLMAAAPMVKARVPDVRFELIGDGPELGACRSMAEELGVAEVCSWFPPQPQERLPSLLSRWALTVMPSACESFGIAALEAGAMRLPVVASQVGGLADAIEDGATGRLVEAGNAEALAKAMVELLERADLRTRMGAAGRRRVVREFDWEVRSQEWFDVYAEARERRCVMV